MTTPTQINALTLQDYIRQYQADGPFEIINGERKPLMPPVTLHNLIVRALFRLLDAHCVKHGTMEVFTEMAFVLVDADDWVKGSRVPDLLLVERDRWTQYRASTPGWAGKPLVLVPDMVVEVVSPNDLYSDLQDKVAHYIEDGVRVVWVVDPNRRRATIYAGDRYTVLDESGTLESPALLPGLRIDLKTVFSDIG